MDGTVIRRFGVAVLAGAIAIATMGTPPASATTTITEEYIGSTGYFSYATLCKSDWGTPTNIGIVCFEQTDGDYVALSIHDESGLPTAGMAYFYVEGRATPQIRICGGEKVRVPVVPGWARLYVFVAGPVEAAWWCLGWGEMGTPATRGFVRATFSP